MVQQQQALRGTVVATGIVATINVEEGEQVRAGQVLVSKPWKLLLDTRGRQGARKDRPCLARKNLPAWAIPMARRLPERDCPDFSWRPPGFDDMKQGLRLSFPGTRYAVHSSRCLGYKLMFCFFKKPCPDQGLHQVVTEALPLGRV